MTNGGEMIQNKFQVNLPIWMTDYLELKTEELDIGMSELLRFHICMSLICSAVEMCDDFESPLMSEVAAKCQARKTDLPEERERFLESVLFEAQRAVKHRIIQEYGKFPHP
jgi:hypothetical protein